MVGVERKVSECCSAHVNFNVSRPSLNNCRKCGDTCIAKSKITAPVVYVSGSITNGGRIKTRKAVKWNVMKAIGVGITLIKLGFAPIIPHLDFLFHYHSRGKSLTWKQFLEWDLGVIWNCDAILRLRGKSKGADTEVEFARESGIPVFYSIKELREYFKI